MCRALSLKEIYWNDQQAVEKMGARFRLMFLATGECLKNKYPVHFTDGIAESGAIHYQALVNADIYMPAHMPALIQHIIKKAWRNQIDLVQHLTNGLATYPQPVIFQHGKITVQVLGNFYTGHGV